MRANFDQALIAILKHEGGLVDHPKDPGGRTNRGVTQAVYNVWRADHQLPIRSVAQITMPEIMNLFKRRYWDAVKGDQMPSGLDYCLFDFGVNSGPARAARFLQDAVEAFPDGQIGPVTLALVKAANAPALIDEICDRRMIFLKRQRTYPTFGKGWSRRVADVRAHAKALAS